MSFATQWRDRFGTEAPLEMEELSSFLAHGSIRKFSDREVPEELAQALVGCAQSAATSSHLQLWSLISVHDPDKRKEIERVAADYRHVSGAPWFFVFLADLYRLQKACSDGGDALDYLEYFTMAAIDASLAAERMACAAESIGLGICYIGAVRNDPERMAQILDLPDGVFPVFGFCLGWPAEGVRMEVKERFSQNEMWFRDRYDRDVDVSEFDERMKAYYEKRKQDPSVTWSQRSCRRTDEAHLTGREVLLEWARARGMIRR